MVDLHLLMQCMFTPSDFYLCLCTCTCMQVTYNVQCTLYMYTGYKFVLVSVYMYMYMHVSCCVFLCTHACYNVLVFQIIGFFSGFQKMLWFSKKNGGFEKKLVVPGFSGKSREIYTRV